MPRLRPLFLLLLLCGFLLRWETEQVWMWADMLRNAPPSQTLAASIDEVLSGDSPCPNCLRLTAQKTSERSETSLVSPEPPPLHLLPVAPEGLPPPSCACRRYFQSVFSPRNPPSPLPLLPPPKMYS